MLGCRQAEEEEEEEEEKGKTEEVEMSCNLLFRKLFDAIRMWVTPHILCPGLAGHPLCQLYPRHNLGLWKESSMLLLDHSMQDWVMLSYPLALLLHYIALYGTIDCLLNKDIRILYLERFRPK